MEWDGNDLGYEKWLADNPHGFVANTGRPKGGRYFRIHLAGHNLPNRARPDTTNPRTGNGYLKVTADSFEELADWAALKLGIIVDQSNCCKQCGPRGVQALSGPATHI